MIKAKVKTRRDGTVSINVDAAGTVSDIRYEMCCIFCEVVSRLEKGGIFDDGVTTDDIIDDIADIAKDMLKARSETE